jgi:hypothetical protein
MTLPNFLFTSRKLGPLYAQLAAAPFLSFRLFSAIKSIKEIFNFLVIENLDADMDFPIAWTSWDLTLGYLRSVLSFSSNYNLTDVFYGNYNLTDLFRTWHPIMLLAELSSMLMYFLSLIVLRLVPTKYIYIQSTTVYVSSLELGLSPPLSRQRVCPSPPPESKGRGHTRLRVRGWGSPNSDDWKKA